MAQLDLFQGAENELTIEVQTKSGLLKLIKAADNVLLEFHEKGNEVGIKLNAELADGLHFLMECAFRENIFKGVQ